VAEGLVKPAPLSRPTLGRRQDVLPRATDVAGGLPGVHLESAWRTGPQWSRRGDRMKVRTSGPGPTGGMRT